MAKPDGRIEKGQRLSTAISAKAWNRAQDAADIVLGARPGVEAVGQVYSQPYISALVNIDNATEEYPHGGVCIELLDAEWDAPAVNTSFAFPSAIPRANQTTYLKGEIAEVEDLLEYETYNSVVPRAFAVSVEPIAIGQTVVRCAVAGLVVAAVRLLSGAHQFVALPRRRSDPDNATAKGRLESSDCGYGIIVKRFNSGWALIKL